MSSGNPQGASAAQDKIEVTGSVRLGSELRLKQSFAAAETTRSGYQAENWMGRRIDHRLVAPPTHQEIAIVNAGLVTGFGIFGAPGTGKSHLVRKILERVLHVQPEPDFKFGGLILDPKGALLNDIRNMEVWTKQFRANDLVVLKPDLLNAQGSGLNVIDCALTPTEMGRMLVLAAQSAGVAAKEPFWFLAWANLFGAALTLLEYKARNVPTLKELLDAILLPSEMGKDVPSLNKGGVGGMRREREVEVIARLLREDQKKQVDNARKRMPFFHPEQVKSDLISAAAQIESFFQSDYVRTLEAFITSAFGSFQQHRFWCLSQNSRSVLEKYGHKAVTPGFYDDIIENGKVVLVSMGPEDPGMGKVLCTLVKCLFQQSAMSRLERKQAGKIRNFDRPLFIACDEYAEIASEVPGQPMGDGRFFSLSRQNGCLGILATQSIHTLENSSLADSWKSIFSNMAAKIFMGAADNETAEQACDLAGKIDWEMSSTTENLGRDNTFSRQRSFEERPELTPYVLTHVLTQGQAVAIGSLDGRKTAPALRFFQVDR